MRVIWLLVGLLDAAMWAAFVILSKRALSFINPIVFNLIIRLVALTALGLVGVPLALAHLSSLDLALTWKAAGYITISASLMWLVSFNAYFTALRLGDVTVVSPITSTDPAFTAAFSFLLLGAALRAPVLAGLVVTVAGVALMARWYSPDDDASEPAGVEAVLPAIAPDPAPRAPATAGRWSAVKARWRSAEVIGLSVLTAATWGVAPILIQEAIESIGYPSMSIVILSQGVGAIVLTPLVLLRRAPLYTRRPSPRERRALIGTVAVCGMIEASFSVLFYLLIDHLGAVLTTIAVATAPVFTLVAGIVLLHERPGWKVILAALVTLAGVMLASIGAA